MKRSFTAVLALALAGCGPSGGLAGGGPLSVDMPRNGAIGYLTPETTIPNRGIGPRPQSYPRDVWTVSLTAGTAYTVLMCKTGTSSIDPYLSVTPPEGFTEEPHYDDDGAGYPNSRVVFTATVTGTYVIYASVFAPVASGSDAGTYRLGVLTGAMNAATCPLP